VKLGGVWGPVALCCYGESLRLLIDALADLSLTRDDARTATILLSSYDLRTAPGSEHKRHLHGAITLIRSQGIDSRCKGLEKASFWIYTRQDVAVAVASME